MLSEKIGNWATMEMVDESAEEYFTWQTEARKLEAVSKWAADMRDAEQRLARTPYPKGSVGHNFIGGQVLLYKSQMHDALDALAEQEAKDEAKDAKA